MEQRVEDNAACIQDGDKTRAEMPSSAVWHPNSMIIKAQVPRSSKAYNIAHVKARGDTAKAKGVREHSIVRIRRFVQDRSQKLLKY
jgi:hypothetical protein